MRLLQLTAAAILVLACSANNQKPTEPADDPVPAKDAPPPTAEPAKDVPVAAPAVRLPTGGSCSECPAPAKCRHVVGMQRGSGREECWVPCQETEASRKASGRATELKTCPEGMSCTFIHNGAGQVCVYPDPDDKDDD